MDMPVLERSDVLEHFRGWSYRWRLSWITDGRAYALDGGVRFPTKRRAKRAKRLFENGLMWGGILID